jgi:hypothetical protein
VPCLPAFQPPEKRICVGRVVSASLYRSDHLTLMGNDSFSTVKTAFGFVKKLFQNGAVHSGRLQPINALASYLPVESN